MTENINANIEQNANEITLREVLEKIENLQNQLTSLKEVSDALRMIDDADEYEYGERALAVIAELMSAKIDAIKYAFSEREKTLNSLLDFYKRIYHDLFQAKSSKYSG